ncbi:hypothetical protein ACROYT_G036409, partial [Oculina patagonica]
CWRTELLQDKLETFLITFQHTMPKRKRGGDWDNEVVFDPEADKKTGSTYTIKDDSLKDDMSNLIDASELICKFGFIKSHSLAGNLLKPSSTISLWSCKQITGGGPLKKMAKKFLFKGAKDFQGFETM